MEQSMAGSEGEERKLRVLIIAKRDSEGPPKKKGTIQNRSPAEKIRKKGRQQD